MKNFDKIMLAKWLIELIVDLFKKKKDTKEKDSGPDTK
jgi:hypothetical protein